MALPKNQPYRHTGYAVVDNEKVSDIELVVMTTKHLEQLCDVLTRYNFLEPPLSTQFDVRSSIGEKVKLLSESPGFLTRDTSQDLRHILSCRNKLIHEYGTDKFYNVESRHRYYHRYQRSAHQLHLIHLSLKYRFYLDFFWCRYGHLLNSRTVYNDSPDNRPHYRQIKLSDIQTKTRFYHANVKRYKPVTQPPRPAQVRERYITTKQQSYSFLFSLVRKIFPKR